MIFHRNIRFLYLFIAMSLLVAPLPLPLIAQDIIQSNTIIDSLKPLHYLDDLLESMSLVDEEYSHSSIIEKLLGDDNHAITQNDVALFLEYAHFFVENNAQILDKDDVEKIKILIELVSQQIENDYLQGETTSPVYRVTRIDDKAVFEKHIHAKKGIHIKKRMRVGKTARFKKNVRIKHKLFARQGFFDEITIADAVTENLTVLSCIDTMCVDNLSVANATIQNLTYGGGSFSDIDQLVEQVAYNTSIIDMMHNCLTCDGSLIDESQLGPITMEGMVANSATTGTNEDVPDTLVERDEFGDFETNNIDMEQSTRYWDELGSYAAIQAPSDLSTNYILSLPIELPLENQLLGINLSAPSRTLRAPAATQIQLEWVDQQAPVTPIENKTIYVMINGNDITGNGSFDKPYATLSKAIEFADNIASDLNPIAIAISNGVYVEDNSLSPLSINTQGISIVGSSSDGVIIIPSTPSSDLLFAHNPIQIRNITFQSPDPLARGIVLSAPGLSVFENVYMYNFLIGIDCVGSAINTYAFNNCLFVNNTTALRIENTWVECNACTIFGISSIASSAANTGILVTGAQSNVVVSSGVIGGCEHACVIENNALVEIKGVTFRRNQFDVEQTGPSNLTLSACLFKMTDNPSDIDIQISGVGAQTEIISCEFDGRNIAGTKQGTAILVSNDAVVNINGAFMDNYITGIHIGTPSDTASTKISTSCVVIQNCITDIIQQGLATLNFNVSTASQSKISINDSTNVTLAFFDLDSNNALSIGSAADKNTTLIQANINPTNNPSIDYKTSLYTTQGLGYDNTDTNNSSTWFVESNDDAYVTGITSDRAHISGIRLVSDEGSPIGGNTALRGWDITKNASTAELAFKYQNSDVVGQSVVAAHPVMQLDGVNNQVQLPNGTQLVFATDTNLYRSSANVLKTDDNFIVGTLTPSRIVTTDGSNQLTSSSVTATELGYMSGTTSPVQSQLNAKVNKSGDTMTGALEIPAGTTTAPSLRFTGNTGTGLSASSNSLSLSTNGAERMNINSAGAVSINNLTSAGVVHNSSAGTLSSSLIVNNDIANATIATSKLANVSSTNVASNIVARDAMGNFDAHMISLSGPVVNNTDVATKAYVDSAISLGLIAHTPARVVSTTNILLNGLFTIDGVALATNDRVLLTGQTNPIENGLWLAQAGSWTRPTDFLSGTEAGQAYILINGGAINTGSSWLSNTPDSIIGTDPITFALFSLPDVTTGANVGTGTGLLFKNKTGITLNFRTLSGDAHTTITSNPDDIVLTTDATPVNTPSTIVARDGSGNFAAGTITANVTGTASNNVIKSGDTMTGTLVHPAGTAAAPSIQFVGSTNTGLSAAISNTLSFDTNGAERMSINPTGQVSVNDLSSVGVVHNDATGLLSTSLIVNADIDPSSSIDDSKLATIVTAGKVANSATTATSLNTPDTIVARDNAGNINATTVIANVVGASSDNVLKAGDTMTGTLQLPAGTTALPSLTFTGSSTSGLSANAGSVSLSTNGAERMKISSGGAISINAFTSAGVVHNDALGNVSSSLITNADVSATAAIVDTKLATITTAGKVTNAATTATFINNPNTIVARDASGNFTAGTITANLTGNATTATTATNVSGSLAGDVTGTQGATVVSTVGGQTAANIAAGSVLANAATSSNTASTIVKRTAAGGFSTAAISVADEVVSNSLTITPFATAGIVHNDASGLLSTSLLVNADVDPAAAIADSKLATISTAGKVSNSATTATNANTASTIVLRDGSGNFSAGTITANLIGNATTATTATTVSGSLSGDVTGTQGATVVNTVGGQTAASIASATALSNAATAANTASTIVRRSATGGFSTAAISVADEVVSNSLTITPFATAGIVHNNASGLLSTSLLVNADVDPAAAIADSKLATISTAGKVANSATTATNANTASTIVLRDGSGNFSAGTITANLVGNATTATTATTVSGSLSGDVTGTQGATVVSTVGGQTAASIASATALSNAATASNTASTIVRRSATGGFSTAAISVADEVISNSLTLTPFSTAGIVHNNTSGLLSTSLIVNADIDSAAAIADSKLATISTAGKVANSATTATNANTASTIVLRDGSGNFSAGTITANLVGNATTATTATTVSGSLSGDVTGTQGATVVSTVGGQTAASIASATALSNAATAANTASTIVRRTATGGFSTAAISVADEVISNSLTLTPFSTAGIVHNNASGLLSSSLIVNADIAAGAAIVDTKLATIATAGKVANSATTGTTSNIANTLVLRDGSGDFAANMISIAGTPTNATDVATKSYVDTSGNGFGTLVAHQPVNVVSTTNVTLLGGLLIDGITLLAGNRVLLVGQTNPVNNGIWIAQLFSWTRPTDFATGTAAGRAYVLVTSGLVNAGTSWVCSTPNAVIGTDPLGFIQFSAPGSLLAVNVGIGTGQLISSQVGNTLNLKSILPGAHVAVANNAADLTLSTDATNLNVAGTIVARDGLGGFVANVANLTDCILSGNLQLLSSASSTAGNIFKGGARFIHNFGTNNTCAGINAGNFTTTGLGNNSCFGVNALAATTLGANNTALGCNTLPLCTTGNNNIALGVNAGSVLVSGSDNIHIGHAGATVSESSIIRIGTPATHNKCFVSGIRGVTTDSATGISVMVDANGQLGTVSSSRDVKHDIQDMNESSDDVMNLRPVTFVYNEDASETTQYGLIAEEVEHVFPALVVRDKNNKPESVQYHVLPVLLLNEVKKQKEQMNSMENTFKSAIDSLQSQLNEFTARMAALENKA